MDITPAYCRTCHDPIAHFPENARCQSCGTLWEPPTLPTHASAPDALDPAVAERLLHVCEELLAATFYVLQHQAASATTTAVQTQLRDARQAVRTALQAQAQRTQAHRPANPYWSTGVR